MSDRKPSRPRLEVSARSKLHAAINSIVGRPDEIVKGEEIYADNGRDSLGLSIADAKRLNAFLTKAIAYLESQRKGGRK